jgi:hypothetical protein
MNDIISIKIDVTKVTKSKLYVGQKGTYLNCSLIPTPKSEYGDYMIVEDTTREEREGGEKGVILGNGKTRVKPQPKPEPKQFEERPTFNPDEKPGVLPF